MIFESLLESAKNNELILINGGICRWHLRKDKQITIREIISIRPGAGTEMLNILKTKPGTNIFAKCPVNLDANLWYKKKGFTLEKIETTRTERKVNHWRLNLT